MLMLVEVEKSTQPLEAAPDGEALRAGPGGVPAVAAAASNRERKGAVNLARSMLDAFDLNGAAPRIVESARPSRRRR
jgi:hypothetical protein